MSRPRRVASGRSQADSGFSLIELIVAMGIFSLLMVIVGALSLSAFRAIREATTRSDIQTQSQNAMEWASRLLRYADVPTGGTTALADASGTGVTVYTYSGTGDVSDAPYRARLFTESRPDGSAAVISEVTTPTKVNGSWVWTGSPRRRQLLTVEDASAGSPLRIEYFACDPANDCATPQRIQPDGTGPLLDPGSTLVPAYLVVSLGDPSVPDRLVTQTVKLVNLS